MEIDRPPTSGRSINWSEIYKSRVLVSIPIGRILPVLKDLSLDSRQRNRKRGAGSRYNCRKKIATDCPETEIKTSSDFLNYNLNIFL